MAKQLPNGWTREDLREMIIQRGLELKRPSKQIFRVLSTLNRISDERLAEIMEELTKEMRSER